jgi:protein subunit release factor A
MEAEKQLESIEAEIIKIMTPKDEADDRGIIIEVRAGTGNTTLHIANVT